MNAGDVIVWNVHFSASTNAPSCEITDRKAVGLVNRTTFRKKCTGEAQVRARALQVLLTLVNDPHNRIVDVQDERGGRRAGGSKRLEAPALQPSGAPCLRF